MLQATRVLMDISNLVKKVERKDQSMIQRKDHFKIVKENLE
jgi:hypothetical protein